MMEDIQLIAVWKAIASASRGSGLPINQAVFVDRKWP